MHLHTNGLPHRRILISCLISILYLSFSTTLAARGITIGAGHSIDLGAGVVSLGCGDLVNDGQLFLGSAVISDVRHLVNGGVIEAQSGELSLTGDWTDNGTFNAGTSLVGMTDGCGTAASTVNGSNTFFDWSATTSAGKQLNFTSGATQNVLNALVFNGSPGGLLAIRSTVADDPGFLELAAGGSQSIDYVDVRDNHAPEPGQFMAPGFPEDYNSVDSGGNFRWFGSNRLTITVYKDFNDGNPAEIVAHKECNTGLPLNVSAGVREGNPITFITNNIDSGATDCTVTETVPAGYSVAYATEAGGETNPDGCVYEDIEQGAELECFITNSVEPAAVTVRKLWFDEHPEFMNPLIAEAEYQCFGEGQVDPASPEGLNLLFFSGSDSSDSFFVIPHWNGQTTCTVSEVTVPLDVESDDSDCEDIPVLLGHTPPQGPGEADCTITNTRFYEGIPTLNSHGLILLALLMLGIGFIGLRRLA